MKAELLRRLAVVPMVAMTIQAFAPTAGATNSWNGYHWARTTSTFALKLRSNLSSGWQPYLSTASTDWSKSTVLDTRIVAGTAGDGRCSPAAGRVKVCDAAYGSNGWLGLASVWVDGSHITKGTVKMNNTYFNSSGYNTVAWRNLVMCQEVGHTLGLDHQDEDPDNANLGTCMDYTRDPVTNQHPNQHDYDELATVYSHADGFTTVGVSNSTVFPSAVGVHDQEDWGIAIRHAPNGRPIVFERNLHGAKKFTFVVWAE